MYTPTMTDRITSTSWTRVIRRREADLLLDLSFEEVRSEELETQWHNMYGGGRRQSRTCSVVTMERDDSGRSRRTAGEFCCTRMQRCPRRSWRHARR